MKIIDLTHEIYSDMSYFNADWHCSIQLERMGAIDKVGRNTTKIILGSHSGTHVDAPSHFIKNGRTITDIKLGELIGKVDILDFSFLKKNEAVTSEMLKSFTFGEKIILFFNWSKNFKDQKRFYSNYPYVSDDACDYLIEKKVKLVGMDTPSPDDSRLKLGSEEDSKVHKKLLQANIILIEYLNNLDSLDTFDGWKIIAMPLNLNGCDGAPARVCLIKEF